MSVTPEAIVVAPICPRCNAAPLAFARSEEPDGTGGGYYECGACGYGTNRDELVVKLLHELRDVSQLFEGFAELALPPLARCRCQSGDRALEALHDLAELLGVRSGAASSKANGQGAHA